jgi:hypothetical protein
MDRKTHDKGLEYRRGAVWRRDELPRKTRSLRRQLSRRA